MKHVYVITVGQWYFAFDNGRDDWEWLPFKEGATEFADKTTANMCARLLRDFFSYQGYESGKIVNVVRRTKRNDSSS